MFNHFYPYGDMHEMNLDSLMLAVKEMSNSLTDFEAFNRIKWLGAWDISKGYEAWSIVDYNHDGYIAIKPVPVGVDINNVDYWVKVANYSALYAEVQTHIAQQDATIAQQNATIANQNTRIADIETALTANRRFVLLGDSYGMESFPGWCHYVKTFLGLAESECYIISETGAGFVGGSRTYLQEFENNFSIISNPNTITDLILLGGYNDIANGVGDGSDVIANAHTQITRIKELLPNARIHLGMVGWSLEYNTAQTALLYQMSRVLNWYKQIAENERIAYIAGIESSTHVIQNMGTDKRHPVADGFKRIAHGVVNYILSGIVSYPQEYFSASVAFNSNYTPSGYFGTHTLEGNIATHYSNPFTVTLGTHVNINVGQQFQLGRMTGGCILGDHTLFPRGATYLTLIGDTVDAVQAYVGIQNGNFVVYVGYNGVPVTKNSFTNIREMRFGPINFVANTF